jgi:hypothetical protein
MTCKFETVEFHEGYNSAITETPEISHKLGKDVDYAIIVVSMGVEHSCEK